MKVLDKSELARAKMVDQIKREIHIMKQLHHAHIVDLKEVMASRNSIFLVLELVPGGELFDHILEHGPMKVGRPTMAFNAVSFLLGASNVQCMSSV